VTQSLSLSLLLALALSLAVCISHVAAIAAEAVIEQTNDWTRALILFGSAHVVIARSNPATVIVDGKATPAPRN